MHPKPGGVNTERAYDSSRDYTEYTEVPANNMAWLLMATTDGCWQHADTIMKILNSSWNTGPILTHFMLNESLGY